VFISKKFADIKILHEGYTADYFLNRMKTNALFPILFIQIIYKKKKNRYRHFLSDYCTVSLPSRTQSLKAAIVFDRDVTVKASSKNALNLQNLIKTVKFLVSTLFFLVERCV
jgi:hypothetical protein